MQVVDERGDLGIVLSRRDLPHGDVEWLPADQGQRDGLVHLPYLGVGLPVGEAFEEAHDVRRLVDLSPKAETKAMFAPPPTVTPRYF